MRTLLSTLKSATNGVIDLIYPTRCLVCETYGAPAVCDVCYAGFSAFSEQICSVCGRPVETDTGQSCRVCAEARLAWGEWGFDAARAAAVYDGTLRYALHRLKYRRVEPLGPALGAHLANCVAADGLLNGVPGAEACDLVIALPSRASREKRRGFNTALLLATPIAEMLGLPLLRPGIVRRRDDRASGPAQVGLSGAARRANVRPSDFTVTDATAVAGKCLLLVDDVFTTGSTVSACARALKDAGAARVIVVTLAGGG